MYYIYIHLRKDNGFPFYVGKGKDKRAYIQRSRSEYWKRIVSKHDYTVEFLEINLDEKTALEKEIYWINLIGRKDLNKGPLINFTDGGEGTSGRKMNDKTKKILNIANKNRVASKLNREKTGDLYRGKFGSDHNRSIQIYCIQLNKNFGSISEASRELNIPISTIHYAISNKTRTRKGYSFQIGV